MLSSETAANLTEARVKYGLHFRQTSCLPHRSSKLFTRWKNDWGGLRGRQYQNRPASTQRERILPVCSCWKPCWKDQWKVKPIVNLTKLHGCWFGKMNFQKFLRKNCHKKEKENWPFEQVLKRKITKCINVCSWYRSKKNTIHKPNQWGKSDYSARLGNLAS